MNSSEPAVLGMDLGSWIGVLLGVVGIAIGYWQYRRSRQTSRLNYAFVESQELISNATFPDLRISAALSTVDGSGENLIERPIVFRYIVKNMGTLPIEGEDFKEPIAAMMADGDPGEIVAVGVSHVKREGIHKVGRVKPEIDGSIPAVVPVLLNRGDYLMVQVLTSCANSAPRLSCWRKGETEVMREVSVGSIRATEAERRLGAALNAIGLFCVLFLVSGFTLAGFKQDQIGYFLLAVAGCLFLVSLGIMFAWAAWIRFIAPIRRSRGIDVAIKSQPD